jgi:hypothetical protein
MRAKVQTEPVFVTVVAGEYVPLSIVMCDNGTCPATVERKVIPQHLKGSARCGFDCES